MKYLTDKDCRKWRNAFYGLPAAYKPGPTWGAFRDEDNDCRPCNVDAKALFAAAARAKKNRVIA